VKIMVTGGAGYIGSVVAEQLVADGREVVVFDDLSKGHADAVPDGAELVRANLIDGRALRVALARGVDAVVHMAASSLVGESVGDPAVYYLNNLVAGLGLLDAMREVGVRSLVLSSTAAVYGEPTKQPIEEDDPTSPTNPYGETKLAFERAMRWYDQAYGLRSAASGTSTRPGPASSAASATIPRRTSSLSCSRRPLAGCRRSSSSAAIIRPGTAPASVTTCTWSISRTLTCSPSTRSPRAARAPSTTSAAAAKATRSAR
jgi:UDP-glucose 4-epimerase